MNLKYCWLEESLDEKENIKVIFLFSILYVTKLAILFLDALTEMRRMKGKISSIKEEEMIETIEAKKIEETTMIKVINLVILL